VSTHSGAGTGTRELRRVCYQQPEHDLLLSHAECHCDTDGGLLSGVGSLGSHWVNPKMGDNIVEGQSKAPINYQKRDGRKGTEREVRELINRGRCCQDATVMALPIVREKTPDGA